jgi:hypothetical protein
MIRYPVQIYPLQRFGNLLCLNASVVGPQGDRTTKWGIVNRIWRGDLGLWR